MKDYSNTYQNFNNFLDWVGVGLAAIFGIECVLKIFAHGFVLGKNSYLRSGWNILDFIIVIASIGGPAFK